MGYTAAPDGWWQTFVSSASGTNRQVGGHATRRQPSRRPVWVDLDGDQLVFMTSAETIKGKSILRDGRVAVCFDDELPPFSFVTVTGTTTTSTDTDDLLYWATRIAGRYMGAELADQFGRRNAVSPEMVVRLTPVDVVAVVDVAD